MPGALAPLALVTGGHRRLGARIAGRLAEAGYALAIHGSRDAVPDAELADAFTRSGTHWSGFIADFTKEGDAERLIPAITAHFGRPPDLLVNSASLFGQDRLETVTTDDLQAHFAVNARAPVLLTRAFAEAPRESEGDLAIINILDQRLVHPHADQLSYTLAKMTLAGFTRIAARALAPRVRVNAVGPGLTLATGDYDPEKIERLASDMPLGRLPTADDVSDAVLYLAGARAVTGQTIVVAGGAQMRSFTRDFMHL
jgi:NAD(P)-dependent dehydrogenase (short-subunit alcohol dehydrogenase family)